MKKVKEKYVDKAYRLKNQSAPLAYMLASKHTRRSPLLYFDDETGQNRPLRYAKNQKSPFEDEQDGNVVLEPIVFEDGLLAVPRSNQVLQKFLYYHPSNGKVFEEINREQDAMESLSFIERGIEAAAIAKDLKGDKLYSVARVMIGARADKMSTPEIRRDILLYAQNDPEDFLDTVNDPMLELYDDTVQFFSKHWLVLKNNGKDVYFNLPKNKQKILSVPFGEDHYFIMSSWFQGDDGVETYKLLKKRLKNKD